MAYTNYQDAAERIIDLITQFIVENDENNLDIGYYRSYVDPTTGQVTVDENQPSTSPIILYEKDFREDNIDPHLYDVINQILTKCLVNGETTGDDDAYTLLEDTSTLVYKPDSGTNPYDEGQTNLAYISFTQSTVAVDADEGTLACGDLTVSNLIIIDGVLNSLSQYISFTQEQTSVDPTLATQILDDTIYELLPKSITRQEEIDKFFAMYSRLKGTPPEWSVNYDDDDFNDHFTSDEYLAGYNEIYSGGHDVVYATDDESGFITRLDVDGEGTTNENKTMEWLRDDLKTFLRDIDSPLITESPDERPEYINQSDGYIKIRNLNQAIIVRSQEDVDVGLIGNDLSNPRWLDTGFTITMWVKFLDRVSTGTLFNYGNPLRSANLNPMGFMLETISINEDETEGTFTDGTTPQQNGFFVDNEYERFIRLVVREADGVIRDSNIGQSFNDRVNTQLLQTDAVNSSILNTFNHTRVPIDFSEWYFIVASYDPTMDEDTFTDDILGIPEYWTGNYDGQNFQSYTGTGAKCKVEIISKSDLIRARGYKSS